jgi:hypothetical protein
MHMQHIIKHIPLQLKLHKLNTNHVYIYQLFLILFELQQQELLIDQYYLQLIQEVFLVILQKKSILPKVEFDSQVFQFLCLFHLLFLG